MKTISSLLTLVIFTYVSVLHFPNLVKAGPQKCSFVLYTSPHGIAHNPLLHFGHLNFNLFALFLAEHVWHPILFPSKLPFAGRRRMLFSMFTFHLFFHAMTVRLPPP